MSKRLVTDQDEIYELIKADEQFTEYVHRDDNGKVYLLGSDLSRKYITQLEMADGSVPKP